MYLWRLEQNSLTWLYLTVELYIFIAGNYMVKFEWLEIYARNFGEYDVIWSLKRVLQTIDGQSDFI